MQLDNLAFWGIFLILIGIALILRVIFNIDFPLLKVLTGFFFILLGLKVMFGNYLTWPLQVRDNELFFKSLEIDASAELLDDYQIVFSKTTFNLSKIYYPGKIKGLKINSIFSGSTIFLPRDIQVNIQVDAVFAGVKMPGRNSPVFGRGSYSSGNFNPDLPYLDIKVNILFGNVTFMYEP